MSDEEDKSKVGYRRPPQETRFRKGVSGNPKGRPAGSGYKSSSEILQEQLMKIIVVREGEEIQTMTAKEALYKRLLNEALKGKPQPTKILLKEIEMLEREQAKNDVKKSIVIELVSPHKV